MRGIIESVAIGGTLMAIIMVLGDILLSIPSLPGAYIYAYISILGASALYARTIHLSAGSGKLRKCVNFFGGYFVCIYGIILIARAWFTYRNYGQFIDLSYYESAIRQMADFVIPRIWDIGSPFWSQHFEPVLFLFVPFWRIGIGGPEILVIGQAIAAVAAAMPLYAYTCRRTGSRAAAVSVSFAYLASGGLQSAFLYGFHPIVFLPFFLITAAYFHEKKRYIAYGCTLLFALSVKEGVSFVAVAWGLWLLFGRRDTVRGLATMLAGLIWYIVSFSVIGYFRGGGYEYWGQFGGGSQNGAFGILEFAFRNPAAFFLQFIDDERKIPTLIELFGSFGLLPLAAPLSLIMLIPSLLLKLLAHDLAILNSFHYSAEIVGLLAIATAEGVRACISRGVHAGRIAAYLFFAAALANTLYGFRFYYHRYAMRFADVRINQFAVSQHARAVDSLIASIPADAGISCEYAVCSHITRPYGKKLPIPHETVQEYVLADPTNPSVLVSAESYRAFMSGRVATTHALVAEADGALLLRRIGGM